MDLEMFADLKCREVPSCLCGESWRLQPSPGSVAIQKLGRYGQGRWSAHTLQFLEMLREPCAFASVYLLNKSRNKQTNKNQLQQEVEK